MKLVDHPEIVDSLRVPTESDPWRVLASGCLMGQACGVDGTDYGMGEALPSWLNLPRIVVVAFCPEAEALGIPRTTPDIHGGDGFDVMAGVARVYDEQGRDLTDEMLAGAKAMVDFALERKVDFAVLTDFSAACGSQVISEGCRFDEERKYQRGVGVATAMLIAHDIAVVSHRDYRTLELLHVKAVPETKPDPEVVDHHETDWVREYFGGHDAPS